MRLRNAIGLLAFYGLFTARLGANPWHGKVVPPGFWWSYWNNNYPNGQAFAERLACRLRNGGAYRESDERDRAGAVA